MSSPGSNGASEPTPASGPAAEQQAFAEGGQHLATNGDRSQTLRGADRGLVASAPPVRPEVAVGAAFAGGLLLALLLRRVRS